MRSSQLATRTDPFANLSLQEGSHYSRKNSYGGNAPREQVSLSFSQYPEVINPTGAVHLSANATEFLHDDHSSVYIKGHLVFEQAPKHDNDKGTLGSASESMLGMLSRSSEFVQLYNRLMGEEDRVSMLDTSFRINQFPWKKEDYGDAVTEFKVYPSSHRGIFNVMIINEDGEKLYEPMSDILQYKRDIEVYNHGTQLSYYKKFREALESIEGKRLSIGIKLTTVSVTEGQGVTLFARLSQIRVLQDLKTTQDETDEVSIFKGIADAIEERKENEPRARKRSIKVSFEDEEDESMSKKKHQTPPTRKEDLEDPPAIIRQKKSKRRVFDIDATDDNATQIEF